MKLPGQRTVPSLGALCLVLLLAVSGCFTGHRQAETPLTDLSMKVETLGTVDGLDAWLVTARSAPAWQLRITPWSDHTVRLEYEAAGASFAPSGLTLYGLIDRPQDPPLLKPHAEGKQLVLAGGGLDIRVDDAGRPIVSVNGNPAVDLAGAKAGVAVSVPLAADEHVYGLGEVFSNIDHRGKSLVANIRYGTNDEAHLSANPFIMSSRGYGLLLDTTYATTFDLGKTTPTATKITSADPHTRVFVFNGPAYKGILQEYANVTGHAALPPKWMFGYVQSKFGYLDRTQLEGVASRLRSDGYPADGLVLDFYWRDNARMVWAENQWPLHQQMLDALHAQGFKVVVHEDTELMRFYPDAPAGARYATDRAESPGLQILDVSNPAATKWYWEQVHVPLLREATPVVKGGVDGFWVDEIDWAPETGSQPFYNKMFPAEMHNLYPDLFLQALGGPYEKSGDRMSLIGRSQWTGGQRYPYPWSGDTATTFTQFGNEIHAGLSMGMSGFPYWGDDLGGFWGKPSDDLQVRWAAQFGAFGAFMRVHGTGSTLNMQTQVDSREPWNFSPQAQAIFKQYDNLRYRLLPYIYSVAHEASSTGLPMLRAMALEFQDENATATISDQYMLGPNILVAPITTATAPNGGQTQLNRSVYLPAGTWTEYQTDTTFKGPARIEWTGPIDRFPVFVRPGAMIPTGPQMDYVDQKPLDPLKIDVWPDAAGTFHLVEDDGKTTQYEKGGVSDRLLRIEPAAKGDDFTFTYGAPNGTFQTPPRTVTVLFHNVGTVVGVTVDGTPTQPTYPPSESSGAHALAVTVPPGKESFTIVVKH